MSHRSFLTLIALICLTGIFAVACDCGLETDQDSFESVACSLAGEKSLCPGQTVRLPLPSRIQVDVSPYESVAQALAGEQTIDWKKDKEKAAAITLAFAATEIRDHLALLGIDAPINLLPTDDNGSKIILAVREVSFNGVADAAQNQGYLILPRQDDLLVAANSPVGVLYGAYRFLELVGFSWDDPDQTLVPADFDRTAPLALEPLCEAPRVDLRGFWIYGPTPDDFTLWMGRNRLNIAGMTNPKLRRKLGIVEWGGGHHLIQQEFSRPGLFENHPEWFGMIDGERQPIPKEGYFVNPCYANNLAAEYFAGRMIDRLSTGDLQGVDIVNIWPMDYRFADNFDQSPEAVALGNETDNLLHFYANLIDHLQAAHEDGRLAEPVRIAGISYYVTWLPPTNRDAIYRLEKTNYLHLFYTNLRSFTGPMDERLPDRDTNRAIVENLNAWRNAADFHYGVVEYHNYSYYGGLGISDFESFAHNFDLLTDGREALFAYMHPLRYNPGPRRLTNRLLAGLSWNNLFALPGENASTIRAAGLIDNYFQRRYLSLADDWQNIYGLMSKAVSNAREIFAHNSLVWALFQQYIWAEPPYTAEEMADAIELYRKGGVQDLPGLWSRVETDRAYFVGLYESLDHLDQAEGQWPGLLADAPLDVARRMEDDIAWFEATASRYRLMDATCDLFLLEDALSMEAETLRSEMAAEIRNLNDSAVLSDTLSPVDQKMFLDWHCRLADIEECGN